MDASGSPFHWLARRHRKRVSHTHHCPEPPPPVSWLGWLDVREHAPKLGWWIGVLYTCGSVLFLLSGIAQEVKNIGDPTASPPGLSSPTARLIGWPTAVAANLCFFPGGILQAGGAGRR